MILKEAQALNPKNTEVLVRLGTLYYLYEKDLGLPFKSDVT